MTITVEEVRSALPEQFRNSVSQDLVVNLQNTINDPEVFETYRENLLSYAHVLQNGKFKTSSYLDAVRYVSFKLMDMTNIKAYSLTFPEKIERFEAQGVAPKDVASYVSAYHKSKLVGLLLEQVLTPSWVLNQDLFQKALNVQAELMLTAASEKVRSDAANSILTHLKQPDTQKFQLDIGVKEDSVISQLKEATAALRAQQRQSIESGLADAQGVAHSKIINAEYSEVTDD